MTDMKLTVIQVNKLLKNRAACDDLKWRNSKIGKMRWECEAALGAGRMLLVSDRVYAILINIIVV